MTSLKSASRMDRIIGNPANMLAADAGAALTADMRTWWVAAADMQREMMTFLSHRLARNADTVQEILSSKSLADVFEIQSRWMQEMLRDYSAEMTKMFAIYSQWGEGVQNKR